MKYTILVKYITGDSFGEEETSDEVGLFSTLEEAQAACEDILEHYNCAKESNYSDDYVKRMKRKPWYRTEGGWRDTWRFTMQTQGQVIGVSWTGYFERLLSLHIKMEEEVDYYV